jgi:fructosamine-3-kinase
VRVPARWVGTAAHRLARPALDKFRRVSRRSEALLGEQLASLHRVGAPRFGWHRDNYIGATPQLNAWDDDWAGFFVRHRLSMQLDR